VMLRRAKCCDPIPGDEVVGYVTRGKGIMIHRKVCPNAMAFANNEEQRLLAYDWPSDGSMYPVMLKIITVNRQGLLMDISTIFGESKTNVSAAKIRTLPNHTAEIEVTIDVSDTQHLAQVMNKISNFSDVISILRMFGRTASK
jgi:GTP diphosphokinase / guanosine-3',5'-bis(diphosphate) 3'-diphosphatase